MENQTGYLPEPAAPRRSSRKLKMCPKRSRLTLKLAEAMQKLRSSRQLTGRSRASGRRRRGACRAARPSPSGSTYSKRFACTAWPAVALSMQSGAEQSIEGGVTFGDRP